jgi:hypothetical protein
MGRKDNKKKNKMEDITASSSGVLGQKMVKLLRENKRINQHVSIGTQTISITLRQI